MSSTDAIFLPRYSVGMGGIGSVIARRMSQGWGMKILYHNRNPIAAGKPGAEYEYCASLEEMLGRADVVSLNMPVSRGSLPGRPGG